MSPAIFVPLVERVRRRAPGECRGGLPDSAIEVELVPVGETQLTGAYEHMQRQYHREARERTTFVAVDACL